MRPRDWPPLTDAQQQLVLACREVVDQEAARVPAVLRRLFGRDEFEQTAWLACCQSVADYDGRIPVTAWVRPLVRGHVRNLAAYLARRRGLYGQAEADAPAAAKPPSPLALWCDSRPARRRLGWRARVALYLRAVEGWGLAEIGSALGVSYQRAQQIVAAGVERVED